ncbi:MAG: effector-associated domain EAD1-containing protein [Geitlerinemataceae cyanobacterium]
MNLRELATLEGTRIATTMSDNHWDKTRKRQFRDALQDVYRDYDALKRFVSDSLNVNLASIADRGIGLEEIAFRLVDDMEARGQLDALYAAFCQESAHHSFAKAAALPGDRYVSHSAIEGVCRAVLTNNGALPVEADLRSAGIGAGKCRSAVR